MAQPEEGVVHFVSEEVLLALVPKVKDEDNVATQLSYCRGQLEMVAVFAERDRLRDQVKTLGEKCLELNTRLKAQEPLLKQQLERDLAARYRLLEDEIDRAYADGLRELDQEIYAKRPRLEPHDSDDLQRVLRNCAERFRILLRTKQ